jgi:hypothetical protein
MNVILDGCSEAMEMFIENSSDILDDLVYGVKNNEKVAAEVMAFLSAVSRNLKAEELVEFIGDDRVCGRG